MRRLAPLAILLVVLGCSGAAVPGSSEPPATRGSAAPVQPTVTTVGPDARLEVTDPPAGANLAEPRVVLRGRGEPGVQIDIDGAPVTAVAPDGSWEVALDLVIGPNRVTVEDGTDRVEVVVFVHPEHELTGTTITTRWDGGVQAYLIEGEPSGRFSGSRHPVARSNDVVSQWLGFAHRWQDGVWRPDRIVDGTVMVLTALGEVDGGEGFRVEDAVDVTVAGDTGTLVTTCFAGGDIRHAALLEYTGSGPRIARLWRVEADDLVEVDPAGADCPDMEVSASDTVGRVFLSGPYDPAVESCGGLVDLSGSAPVASGLWTHSGACLDQTGSVFGHIVSVVSDRSESTDDGWRQLWLGDFLAWNLDGTPIFRVSAAVDLPPGDPVHLDCWDGSGNPVVVLGHLDTEGGATGTAWRVASPIDRFVQVDVASVGCEVVVP